MVRDYTAFLWLLKLGGVSNLLLLAQLRALDAGAGIGAAHSALPAQVFLAVSAYRCFFPVRYEDQVVLHDSFLSSIFLTRLLATLAEVAYIFLFSQVLRSSNVDDVAWVNILSWVMVAQVVVSQAFVWGAVLTGQRLLFYYEECGWAIIFAANALASAPLLLTVQAHPDAALLLKLNLFFAVTYLPWQVFHLAKLRRDARGRAAPTRSLAVGLREAMQRRNRRTDAQSWGGVVGASWMAGYWVLLIPPWVYLVARVLAAWPAPA